ncbi:putative ubiquitin hydrolase [Trypanosoma theileri]|uniref:Putative ubiquitin hydrolase n=1 Tax=Trypanosoma theileri TaxID=67003 RepID=A0A1X0P1X7_9TRYP|nr:putative ubiquitin hydrolase [Trypanosoma theileri]ORC90946.1 putative ubiquitin hydrolase [Trypanosoma theileri]
MSCSCIEHVEVKHVRSVIAKVWFGSTASPGDSSLFRCVLCEERQQFSSSKKTTFPLLRSRHKTKTGAESSGEMSGDDVFLCLTCGSFFCLDHTKGHYENERKKCTDSIDNNGRNHSVFFGVPSCEYTNCKRHPGGKIKSIFPTFGEQRIKELREGKPFDLERERAIVPLISNDSPNDWIFFIWCVCIGKPFGFRISNNTESDRLLEHVKELGFLIAKCCFLYQKGIRLDFSVDESGSNRLSKESEDSSSQTRSGGDSQSVHGKTTDGESQTVSNPSIKGSSLKVRNTKIDPKCSVYSRVAGIKNPLNTCYFNAVLQCVLKCQFFTRRLLSIEESSLPGPLSRSLCNMMRYMNGEGEGDTYPRDVYPYAQAVLRSLCDISPIFSKDEQQDCQELFLCLANGVADEFDEGKSEEQKKKEPRISFEGVMRTEVTCKQCKKHIPREEMFMALSVPVEDSIESGLRRLFQPVELKGKDQYACEECFKRLSKDEQMSHNATVKAENDKKAKEKSKKKTTSEEKRSLNCVYSDARVETCISRLGGTMVLHLLRFHFDGRDFQKITRNVSFRMSLDLSPYVSKQVLQEYERRRALSVLQARFSHLRYDVLVHFLDCANNDLAEAERLLADEEKKGHINTGDYSLSDVQDSTDTTKLNSVDNNKNTSVNGDGDYNTSLTGSKMSGSNHEDVPCSPKKKREYQPSLERSLVGIVTHRGSLHGGHYVAYVRDVGNSNKWFRCDDDEVEIVEEEQVLKCQSEVYMLFYE